jgi:ankyrin repeat protein
MGNSTSAVAPFTPLNETSSLTVPDETDKEQEKISTTSIDKSRTIDKFEINDTPKTDEEQKSTPSVVDEKQIDKPSETNKVSETNKEEVPQTNSFLTAVKDNSQHKMDKAIISHKLGRNNIDEKDKNGNTALMLATINNNDKFVKILLGLGANPNIQNLYGNTPLLWSLIYKFRNVCNMILESPVNVNVSDKMGNTTLMLACSNNWDAEFDKIVKYGFDEFDGMNKVCHTALHHAVKSKNMKMIKTLLSKMKKIDIVSSTKTPLIHAVEAHSYEIVVELLNFYKSHDVKPEDIYLYKQLIEFSSKQKNKKIYNVLVEHLSV